MEELKSMIQNDAFMVGRILMDFELGFSYF